jgi:hypothetical protein
VHLVREQPGQAVAVPVPVVTPETPLGGLLWAVLLALTGWALAALLDRVDRARRARHRRP